MQEDQVKNASWKTTSLRGGTASGVDRGKSSWFPRIRRENKLENTRIIDKEKERDLEGR